MAFQLSTFLFDSIFLLDSMTTTRGGGLWFIYVYNQYMQYNNQSFMQLKISTEGLDRRRSSSLNQHLNDNHWGPCRAMQHAYKWQWCVVILCRCYPTGRNSLLAPGFSRMKDLATDLNSVILIGKYGLLVLSDGEIYFWYWTMLVVVCILNKMQYVVRIVL